MSAIVVIAALTVAGCSIEDTAPNRSDSSPAAGIAEGEPSTTAAVEEQPAPGSAAFVEVAGAAYDLDAECYSAGVGEILITALAPGDEGPRVELYLQAFLGAPYVGITVIDGGDSTTYEPVLGLRPTIVRIDDVFRLDDIALVTGLDLETGEAIDAGVGTIVVECDGYTEGLPPGFVAE